MIKNKLKLFSLAVLCFIALNQPVFAKGSKDKANDPNIMRQISAGTVFIYSGKLNSGVISHPIKTTFYRDTAGNLKGEYMFNNKGTEVFGTLSNPRMNAEHVLFNWKDIYGGGTMKIKLTESLDNFQSFWDFDDRRPDTFTWDGQKTFGY